MKSKKQTKNLDAQSEENPSVGRFGEPWKGVKYDIHDSKGVSLREMDGYAVDGLEIRDRIISCVNAMEGIKDPEGFVQDIWAMRNALSPNCFCSENGESCCFCRVLKGVGIK